MSTKNNTQRFAKIANRREHYGIRKLTVGVASVLLGTTLWLGKNADMVHADETDSGKDSSNQDESSDVTMPSVSENTQVRVEAPQAASNEDQSSVSGDAQAANTQSSENEQKVAVPAASEHAENQITVASSDAKTQSTQTSASGVKTQENNSQAVAPSNNQDQSTNAEAANKINDAGQNNENKSTNESAKVDEKTTSIQSDLEQDKIDTKSNASTQELKVNDLSSDLNDKELVTNLTKGNQILVKQSKSVLNAVADKKIDSTNLDDYATVNNYDGLRNAIDNSSINGVNIDGTIDVNGDLNIDRAFTIKGINNSVLNLDSHKINNTGNLTLDDITVNGSVMGDGTVNIKGNVISNVDDSNGYDLTRDERNEKGLETNWDQTKGNNIQATTVNVDDNASLTINRSSVGDGIHLVNNGAVNVADYGKLTINMNTNNDLDTTARYHDAGIFAEGNGTFTAGTKSVVTLNTSIGQGISMTGVRPNMTDDDRFGGYTAAQSRPGGSGQINLGRYSTTNLTGRDGVILGDNSNFNVGDYANVHFENKGRGVALDLANQSNINIGDHAVTYFHSVGKTTEDARGKKTTASGSYDGYNYIGVNEGGNITVGKDATFRVILQDRGDDAWDDVIQLDSRNTNTEAAFTSKKGAIVDLRDDNTNFYAELIGSMGNAKLTIDFDNPLLLNLQRYSTGGETTGWSAGVGQGNTRTSNKYTANLFYIGGSGTISIDGNNDIVYQQIKSDGSQQIWRNVNGLKVDQNGFATKNIYDNGANSDLSINGDGLVGGVPANQVRNNQTDPTAEGQNSPAYGISFMRAEHQIWIPNEGNNQITGTHTNTIKYVYSDGTPVLDANGQPIVATQKYNLTRDVNTELTPEQIEALPDYALNHTADEVRNYIQKAGAVTQDSGWKITNDQGQTVNDPNITITSPVENGYTATVQSSNAPGVVVGSNGSNIDAKLTMDPSKDVVQNGYLSATYRNNGITGIPNNYVTTVAYNRDNEEGSVQVIFHDDATNSTIPDVGYDSGSQKAGTSVDYTTTEDISNLENKGYEYVSTDGTIPSEITGNQNVTVTVHMRQNVEPDEPNTPASDQNAVVNYVDADNNNSQIAVSGLLSGKAGDRIDYSTAATITDLENQGYMLVNDGFPRDAAYDDDDSTTQTYTVVLNHGTVLVTPDKPGKPGEPINPNDPDGPKWPDGTDEDSIKKTGIQTIHYVGAGDKTPADNKQDYTFTKNMVVDKVTGKIIDQGSWNATSHTFGTLETPVVDGYHADKRNAGGTAVTIDDLNKTVTVTYTPNGKIVPVDPKGVLIPNVPTPQYPTDPTDPTKVVPDEPVPIVPGMTPSTPTVTPTDPGKDTPIPYNPVTPVRDQIAQIIYRDVNDPSNVTQIGTSGNISGASGSEINYDPSTEITNFESRGYELKNNGFPASALFDNDDSKNQTFYIDFVHKTTTITPENPGQPGETINPNDLDGPKWPTGTDAKTLRVDGKQTIHYQYDNGTQAAPDNVQNATFDHTLVFDNVTGQQVADRGWTPESHKFNDVVSPTINGYHTTHTTVTGTTVTPDNPNQEITVIYTKNGTHLVNRQEVTALQIVRYIDDQGNELSAPENQHFIFEYSGDTIDDQTNQIISRGSWNESSHKYEDVSVPVINGYVTGQRTYEGQTCTPSDPNKEITIVYHKISKIVPVDPNHDPIPDAPTPSYVNDSTDPTKVTPNEPVPNVPNMTPETPNVTPTDPTVDTPVVYNTSTPVTPDTPDQSTVSITFNDVDANAAQDSDEVKSQLTTPITLTGANGAIIDLSQVTIPTNFLLSGDRPTDKKFGTDNAITLNVTHQRQDVSDTDPNASTSVKRTITITNPNDGDHDMSQTLTLHRSAVKDLVTNTVDYGQWNNGQFGEVVVPAVVGYTPSQNTIPAIQNVTADYVDPKIHVVYTANDSDESTQIISYVNNGKEVGQQVVKGKVGDTFQITPELPDGWEREKDIPVNITISPNGKGTTIVVPVDPLKITISPDQVTTDMSIWGTDDHDQQDADILPGTKAKHLKSDINYDDLHTFAKRGIVIISPNGQLSKDSIVQTVEFKRSAIVNAITGKVESYTDWVPEDGDGFRRMTIPIIDGYTASQSEVPELDNIKVDYKDPQIVITYKGNPNQQIINYKDINGNVVGKQTIDGNNGQIITINSTIPDGYKLADNSEDIPKKTELEPNNKEINVVVTPIVSTIDSSQVTQDKPIKTTDVLSGTQNKHLKSDLTYNDLHKDVTRTVTVKLPDGTTLPTVQTVHFVRSANINKATGDVTYSNWTPEGDASLAKIDIPAIDGYSPNETVINPIANVTDNYQDPKIEITYKPSDSSQTINFVDGNGNVVGTQKISGTTNEIKDLTIQTPDGWQTATGNLPKQVRIHSSDTPISIYVVPKEVNIKPDEVTEDKSFTTNEVLPGTQNKHAKENISYGDLHKTVDRKINITLPDGTVKTVYQGVRFKRSASINTATGDVTFGNWSADGPDNLNKVDMPQVTGYIPAGDVWAINYLNEDEDPKDLNINYVADTPANRLAVAKQNMVAIQNAIQDLQTEISNKEDVLNKITSQHKASQKDLADKEKEVNELTPNDPDAADPINDESLEDALIKAKKSVSDVLDQINGENESIDSLKSRLADANNIMAKYKQKKGDLSASIDQDQKLIDQLNTQIAKVQKALADQVTDFHENIELNQDYKDAIKKYNSDLTKIYVNGDKTLTVRQATKEFNEAMAKATEKLLNQLSEDPRTNSAYHHDEGQPFHPLVWDTDAKKRIVNLDDLTSDSDETREISDYALSLLNNIRGQLGLSPLKPSKETRKFAMDIAKRYQTDRWTHMHHDNVGINDVADKYGLQQYKDKNNVVAPDKGQYYESLDSWKAKNSFGLMHYEDKSKGINGLAVYPIRPLNDDERKDMQNHITDMDSIKQGIYGNMVSMLLNDNWGNNKENPWGHTRQLLGIGYPIDYTYPNITTKFAMSADYIDGKDEDSQYTQHFILVPNFDIQTDNNGKYVNEKWGDKNDSEGQSTQARGSLAQFQAAQDELNKYIEQRDELLKSLEEKKRELNDNDSKISNNQSVISALQDAIDQKQSKIDQLKNQLPDVQNKLKAAQDSLNKHNSDAQAKQKDVQQKVQDLQKAQSELTQLQDQIKKQDSQIADLTTKTDNLKKRKIEYDKVSDDIKQNVDHATDKNNQQNQGGQENQNTQNNQNNGGQVQNNSGNNVNSNAGSAVNTTEATNATNNVANTATANNAATPQQETDTSAPVNTSSQDNTSDEGEPDTADMNDGNYSSSSKHAKSANEAPRAEVQHNAPKAINAAPVHGESTTQSYVETSSNKLNTNHSESTLPQTGENDDLAAIIAGDLAASLGLIGLVGLKKKKRE